MSRRAMTCILFLACLLALAAPATAQQPPSSAQSTPTATQQPAQTQEYTLPPAILAKAITLCTALKIDRAEMVRVLHEEHAFSDLFLRFLLARSMRTQADLIDQLFNSSEKRLARILLLKAEFGKPGEPEMLIPPITQEALAEMIGTTRSRVSYFMNCFRTLGFIEYNGRIRVHKSLLNVVLHDQLPESNSERPAVSASPSS